MPAMRSLRHRRALTETWRSGERSVGVFCAHDPRSWSGGSRSGRLKPRPTATRRRRRGPPLR